jgi:Glutathione S-transferase
MKLYDFAPAPSPRRVRIFLAEKGVTVPTVQVDLRSGEHLGEAFRKINPWCTVPALELDDGTTISESIAICCYLEAAFPEPPLMGRTPMEKGVIAMWEHWAEMDGFFAAAEAFRNSTPGMRGRALTGAANVDQIPELVERGRARTERFYQALNDRLAESEFIAGPEYTVADITAMITVDFAGWMKLVPGEDQVHLKRWHAAVSSRPSAKA